MTLPVGDAAASLAGALPAPPTSSGEVIVASSAELALRIGGSVGLASGAALGVDVIGKGSVLGEEVIAFSAAPGDDGMSSE